MASLAGPERITDGPLAGAARWQLEVLGVHAVAPAVRRLRLGAPELGSLAPQPGQDLMLRVPGEGGGTNRRYSIRAFDAVAGTVDVDVVLHGDGPGARWAAGAAVGDVVEAVGPRGKVVPREGVAGHLFVGDAAGAPAMLSMLEFAVAFAMPARALLVLAGDDERQPTSAPTDRLHVLVGAGDDEVRAALDALVQPGWHVYLAAERGDVRRWQAHLVAAGVPEASVSAKAYWSRAAANAPHGEPTREP